MAEVALKAEPRDETGKGPARRLRANGQVPAILYGRGMDPVRVSVDAHALGRTLSTDAGANVLIDLEVGSESHLTLARSVERHPLRGTYIHVDFLKISRDEVITIDVPLHFEGEAAGTKEGGVLEHQLWQLHAQCLPTDVPDGISVDVSGLAVGDSLRVSDIVAPQGVTILNNPDDLVLACIVPQAPVLEEVAPEGELLAEGEEAPAEGEAAEDGEAAPEEGEGEEG